MRAVAEANLLDPKPDFVMFGGDLAQLGKPEEIDHGLEILSALHQKPRFVLGEHDFYLDMGEYWAKKVSEATPASNMANALFHKNIARAVEMMPR